MIGGQVLIIFVGSEAFKIVPLNGKEWGISIGLGAISIPWGAVIRKFPDEWVSAMAPSLPKFMHRKNKKQEEPVTEKEGSDKDSLESLKPPLRVLSAMRGQRHQGFRERMHDAKVKAKDKIHHHEHSS